MKKWIKLKQAYMFRLSNKVIQFTFFDDTEIILSFNQKRVTYLSLQSKMQVYSFVNASECNDPEMTSKLKYAREILSKVMTTGRQNDA